MNTNFGNKVTVKFQNPERTVVFRNVTEIHFNFPSALKDKRIAFESDIHRTGCTYAFEDVLEFETALETEKQIDFG